MRSATRFSPALLAFATSLSSQDLSIAEIHRAVGGRAAELGVPRPSYERTRQIVAELRFDDLIPSWGELLLDVDLRLRPPEALIQKASGAWPMDEDAGLRRSPRRPKH